MTNRTALQAMSVNLLAQVNEVKCLGIILDPKRTWAAQSLYFQGKLRKLNCGRYHASKHSPVRHLLEIYNAIYDFVI